MKKILAQLLFILLFCTWATAYPIPGTSIMISDGQFGTVGGEYDINVSGTQFDVDYVSFCLERNEYISFDTSYTITSISDYSEMGGVNGAVNGRDYLDDVTKYVYWNYTFTDMFGPRTDALSDTVQEIVWFLEDEVDSVSPATSLFYSQYLFGVNDYSIAGSVQVMNIISYENDVGIYAQSQLIGENVAPVPEPTTMLLFGTGLIGLAASRRIRGGRESPTTTNS